MTARISRYFDLNVETVLEGWSATHALREFIANAIDESVLSATDLPKVSKQSNGWWEIRDYGRGIRYEHLTQNESLEKHRNPDRVIGRFGVGLKDALAVLSRKGIEVELESRHGIISLSRQPKVDFVDVVTLHAKVSAASDPSIRGTVIRIRGVEDDDVWAAQQCFLAFTDAQILDRTAFGDILERTGGTARIFVNGMVIAEEENFAFS